MSESNDLEAALPRFTARADALRASGLRGLERVTLARQTGLEREHRRLTEKLGADDPHTRALEARIHTGSQRLRDLAIEVARAEAAAPAAGVQDCTVYGYVWWKDLKPAADLTVTLVDTRGKWLEEFGFACTDDRGRFQLAATGTGEEHESTERAGGQNTSSDRSAYIRVTDRDHHQVYRGEQAVSLSPGSGMYLEIILGDPTAPGCSPPEEDFPGAPGGAGEQRSKRRKRRG